MSGAKAVLRLGGGFNVGAVLLRSRSAERRLRPPISKDNIVRGGTMREHLSDHTRLCNRTRIVAIFACDWTMRKRECQSQKISNQHK